MSTKSRKLDFLIVGVAKCGTTALSDYLNQSEEVFISNPKEPKFLTYDFLKEGYCGKGDDFTKKKLIKNKEDYFKLFAKAESSQVIGEASVDTFYYFDKTIPIIKEIIGDPKIIIMLRNPLKRAFSAYSHLIRDGRESLSFKNGIECEDERLNMGYEFIWGYKSGGFYYDGCKSFLEQFSNVKIVFFEDFISNQEKVVQEVFQFLNVESSSMKLKNVHQNISGKPKSQLLNNLLFRDSYIKSILKFVLPEGKRSSMKSLVQKRNLNPIKASQEELNYLKGVYNDDIIQLSNLLDKNLSHW